MGALIMLRRGGAVVADGSPLIVQGLIAYRMLERSPISIKRVFWRALRMIAAIELAYLALANALLGSSLLQRCVASADGIQLEYGAAFSIVPGKVHARRVRLRFEDYNVQFQLDVGNAVFEVSLHELVFRRFHVLSMRAHAVRFRMRHKVSEVGLNAVRLRSYPPIEGFSEPPIYRGTPSMPISDEDYRLWQVQLDQVIADVEELWVLEYRFEGRAVASGSFLLKPARWVDVQNAILTLHGGTLSTGGSGAQALVSGQLRSTVAGLDVRRWTGMQVFKAISAQAVLALRNWDLDFLNQYTKPRYGVSTRGPLDVEVDVVLDHGTFTQSSRLLAKSVGFSVASAEWLTRGDLLLRLDPASRIQLGGMLIRMDDAALRNVPQRRVWVQDGQLSLVVVPTALEVWRPMRLDMRSARLHAYWSPSAILRSTDADLDVSAGDLRVVLDCTYEQARSAGSGECETRGALLRAKPTAMDAHVRFRTAKSREWYAEGAVSVRLKGIDGITSEAKSAWLSGIPSALVPDRIDATIAFNLSMNRQLLEVTHAEGGAFRAGGFFLRTKERLGHAALRLRSGPITLGVNVGRYGIALTPLAGDDWLRERRRELGLRPD
jgi:hypothetical protein